MINTVWQVFIGFLIAFVVKRLLYIGCRVFRKKRKIKLEVQNGLERLFPIFGFGSQQRILCRNRVLRLGVVTVGYGVTTRLVWARQGTPIDAQLAQ